jgi:hypothetical protein
MAKRSTVLNAALSILAPLRRMREMERSTSKRSRTGVLTRTRARQQTAVPASLKWVFITAPGFAFLLLVERLGTAQPTLTSPQLVQKIPDHHQAKLSSAFSPVESLALSLPLMGLYGHQRRATLPETDCLVSAFIGSDWY